MGSKKRIVVLISGNGSNLQALIDAVEQGLISGQIVGVISNKSTAFGLQRAQSAGIENKTLSYAPFAAAESSRSAYDTELAKLVGSYQPDLIVLAGFMRILSGSFLDCFKDKVINLHPALPGAYPGINAIARAWADYEAGLTQTTGVMVHYVIPEVDAGPVIAQACVAMNSCQTLGELADRMHEVEHELIVEVVKTLCQK
ncbi:MAG: phosphoribosylglycinamide formyltransferase [Myxococcota bacterium]|nr:phosphoribosylglycinamide formyltransferase [Myxococcota bacterium]